jgi:LysR family hydrogen peroxide-inducible transcriptional activator
MHSGHQERIMEMHEVRYFLAACETNNFHRAAASCNVTQPALTRAIRKLEDELGGALFRRDHSGVHLTDFGRLMRPHLEEVHGRTKNAKQVARSFLKLEAAPLTLGVMCTIGPMRFVGFLNSFRDDHRGIEVSMVESVPSRLTDLLLDGSLDVALMAQPNSFDQRLSAEPIYRERFGLAFPVGHALEQRETVRVTDVQGETYLSRINCEYRDYLAELCRERGVDFRRGFRSEREDWILMMVAAGMGICFLPEYSATHPGVGHRVVEAPAVSRDVCLVTVAGRMISTAAETFIDAVRAYDWRGRIPVACS